jgi:hypothetical protein
MSIDVPVNQMLLAPPQAPPGAKGFSTCRTILLRYVPCNSSQATDRGEGADVEGASGLVHDVFFASAL